MDIDRYIGRLLDNRYEILEVIGTGGMAVVYKARCHRLNRLVAIKILKDEFSRDEEFRRRFHAEGEAVAMLSHPNIVAVYDVSSTNDANFIVMELIDGITLKQYMEKKGVLNWKETLHFGIQIAKALEHAHGRGIIHRDIKPHNVMVLKNGSVKVADFGIARVMSKSNTLTKEALGSVHYISPEQAKGGWVDNRSDLYSLSVVMYEMMAGRPPYDGESPVAVAIQHINGGAAMPSTLNPNIPGGLEQIIMKGMALDTKDRYSSAAEMLRDMDEFRKDPTILFAGAVAAPVAEATRVLPSTAQLAAETPRQPRTTAERVAGGVRVPRNTGNDPAAGPIRSTMGAGHRATGPIPGNPPANRSRSTDDMEAARRAAAARAAQAAAAERARKEREAKEENRGRVATIAVVACSAVAIVAIIIFLIALSNGAFFKEQALVTIPNLVGEMYQDLPNYETFKVEILERRYDETYEKGLIIDQTISPDSRVVEGTVVKVVVSMGPEPLVKIMEDMTQDGGVTLHEAKSYLDAQGMKCLVFETPHEEYEAGRVYKTEPEAGVELVDGQTVKVYVSTGPETIMAEMPNVVGMQYDAAVQTLYGAGFSVISYESKESDEPQDEVIEQPFKKGEKVDVTTAIVLTISEGPKPTTEPPTEPPTNSTDPEEVTQIYTFTLPTDRTADYMLSLRQNGKDIIEPAYVVAGTASIQVQLTGSGVEYYELYIDDVYYSTEKVEFTVNG
ncbi:MAG: Stk1 family PASTA domain-containing Ser/Thr kinase [Oscillospiraceae bacterium]|nr:Stk1 family PASTA domain-containing Ser/Thr kinase [Oscillospiraceae bacterium]